jgi:hypothetical protein
MFGLLGDAVLVTAAIGVLIVVLRAIVRREIDRRPPR